MTYGTIPVVTDVGGLHDTVVDADRNPGAGTGFLACTPDAPAIVDATKRALVAHRQPERWRAIQDRAMGDDWSWATPARRYHDLYLGLRAAGG
jgi:starch synthase